MIEDAVRGRHGARLQKELTEKGLDEGSLYLFGNEIFTNAEMGSGVFERLERETLYLATGLSQDEAVLPLIKATIRATGQEVLHEDSFYLEHRGRWAFDAAVGTASNPLTYFAAAGTTFTTVRSGSQALRLAPKPSLSCATTQIDVSPGGTSLSSARQGVAPDNACFNVYDQTAFTIQS